MSRQRSSNLPTRTVYETAVEDLAKLLQDTGNSVQRILSSFSTASTKPLLSKVSDVRTSLCIGIIPSTLNNREHPLPAEARSLLHNEGTLVGTLAPGQFRTPASKALQHQQDVQNWFAQAHPENAGRGKISLGPSVFDFNEEDTSGTRSSVFDFNEDNTLANEKALKVFLEEIKRTISDWSSRQKVLGQEKARSTRSVSHIGTTVISASGLSNGPPFSLGFNKEQSKKATGTQGVKEPPVHQAVKEVDESARVVPQQGKEAEQSLLKSEHEKSTRLEKVVDDIASQLLESDNEDMLTNHHEQPLAARTRNPSEKEKTAEAPPTAEAGVEQGSSSQGAPAATEGDGDDTPAQAVVTPLADDYVTPTKVDQTESKLPLTKWKPPSSAAKNTERSLSFPRAVEVISSPDWLPEGWVTELKTRGSGNSAGSKDKYYVDPVTNRRFRSRKEVVAYLERGKPKPSDSPERSPIKKLLGPELLPAVPKKSHKKQKPKESSVPSSSGLPPPMVPSIASSGLVGNMYMPPYRTGQPSEWLVYESLASLPFPMFDPYYYTDFGANKSSSSKGSHMPARPWFFSGPEASWSPFMDRSKPGEKGRDYHSYLSMPAYPSVDAAAKSSVGGSKKSSSKRKSGEL